MSISFNTKPDTSYLFSGLGGSSSVGGNNFLADYASIKNGSYYKLMKAYYNETGNASSIINDKKNTSTSKDDVKTLSQIQSATDSLKDSADALLKTGSKSLFTQKDITTTDKEGNSTTAKGYDTEAIYSAVKSFVKDYNSVVNATKDSNSNTIATRSNSLVNLAKVNSKLLSKVGISIDSKSNLSIDEDTFKKADMNTVKTLFNGNGSFAYQTSAQASLINFTADNEASKGNTYNTGGKYNYNFNSGSIFNSYL